MGRLVLLAAVLCAARELAVGWRGDVGARGGLRSAWPDIQQGHDAQQGSQPCANSPDPRRQANCADQCGNQTWGHGCAYDAHGRLDISRRRVDLHVEVRSCASFCTKLAVRGRSVAKAERRRRRGYAGNGCRSVAASDLERLGRSCSDFYEIIARGYYYYNVLAETEPIPARDVYVSCRGDPNGGPGCVGNETSVGVGCSDCKATFGQLGECVNYNSACTDASSLNPKLKLVDLDDWDVTITPKPTPAPTKEPTPMPTDAPTDAPSAEPTPEPTADPTPAPTPQPTQLPPPTGTPTPPPSPAYDFTGTILQGSQIEVEGINATGRVREGSLATLWQAETAAGAKWTAANVTLFNLQQDSSWKLNPARFRGDYRPTAASAGAAGGALTEIHALRTGPVLLVLLDGFDACATLCAKLPAPTVACESASCGGAAALRDYSCTPVELAAMAGDAAAATGDCADLVTHGCRDMARDCADYFSRQAGVYKVCGAADVATAADRPSCEGIPVEQCCSTGEVLPCAGSIFPAC